jgi:hypothetical protein
LTNKLASAALHRFSLSLPFSAALLWVYSDFRSFGALTTLTVLTIVFSVSSSTLHSLLAVSVSVCAFGVLASMPILNKVMMERSAVVSIFILLALLVGALLVLEQVDPTIKQTMNVQNIIPLFGLIIASTPWRFRDSLEALNLLSNTEDNSAWLQGMSANFGQHNDLIFSPNSGWASGRVLGGIHLISQFFEHVVGGMPTSYASDSLALIHTYGILIGLVVATALAIGVRMLHEAAQKELWRTLAFSTSLGLITYACCASMILSGHLAFLAALWILLASTTMTIAMPSSKFSLFFAFITIVSVSQVWTPLSPYVLLYALAVVTRYLKPSELITRLRSTISFKSVMVLVIAATASGWMVYTTAGPTIRAGLQLSTLTMLLGAAGGTVAPNWLLSAVVLVTGFIVLIKTRSNSAHTMPPQYVASAAIIYLFFIYAGTFLLGTHTPSYAARKLEMLVVSLVLITLVILIPKWLAARNKIRFIGPAIALISVLFITDGSIAASLRYPFNQLAISRPWVEVAISEIALHPERQIICLPVSEDDHTASYLCNRMIQGLQGTVSYENIANWTALGFYMNDAKRLTSLPRDFYNTITMLTPATGLPTNTNPNVQEVYDSIPWNVVRIARY